MKQLNRFVTTWLPVLLWMGVIFYFSSRQRVVMSEQPTVNFLIFKFFHLVEYGFLFFLLFRSFKYASSTLKTQWGRYAFIITLIYAASDELHQRFVPTRGSALRDVIIDCLGAGITWILLTHITRILPEKLKTWLAQWQLL